MRYVFLSRNSADQKWEHATRKPYIAKDLSRFYAMLEEIQVGFDFVKWRLVNPGEE